MTDSTPKLARRHARRALPLLGALAALALLAGCGSSEPSKTTTTTTPAASGGGAPASGPVAVDIKDYKFHPASVTVKAGAKITFANSDSSEHTATSSDATAFDTGALTDGHSKTVTLSKAGTYAYICSFHPYMHGTIIVK